MRKLSGLAFAAALGCAATLPAHAGLVALYTYDNATRIGADSSGNGNDLIAGMGAPAGVAGKYGGGVDLNGATALVASSGSIRGLPTGSSSYTIASWINPDTAGGNNAGGIVGWGNYGTNNQVVALRMNGTSSIHQYWWANDLTAYPNADLTGGSGSNGWHFVAATYDATTHFNAIYIDGNLSAYRYGYNLNDANANFAVGKTVGTEFFDGQLDNTAIFDQALTLSQLNRVAANDFSEFTVPEPATVALFGLGFAAIATLRRRR